MEENKNTNTFEYIEEQDNNILTTSNEEKIDEETKEAFVTGLPDWDLTPPYEVIRRVS